MSERLLATSLLVILATICTRAAFSQTGETLDDESTQHDTADPEVPPANSIIEVSSAMELLQAIGSDRTISLAPGVYDIHSVLALVHYGSISLSSPFLSFRETSSSSILTIDGVSNLRIIGPADGCGEVSATAHLVQTDVNDTVLHFNNASHLTIENVMAGHGLEAYTDTCSGNVFSFDDSTDVHILNSRLYGSGAVGLVLRDTRAVTFESGRIEGCSYLAISAEDSSLTVQDSLIEHAVWPAMVNLEGESDVQFFNSVLDDTRTHGENPIFEVRDQSEVVLQDSTVRSVAHRCLAEPSADVQLTGTTLEGVTICE